MSYTLNPKRMKEKNWNYNSRFMDVGQIGKMTFAESVLQISGKFVNGSVNYHSMNNNKKKKKKEMKMIISCDWTPIIIEYK